MSVLVKGMKMPKGCFQKEFPHRCPFCTGTKCVLMNEVIPQRVNRRLDGCPIDEVPEHGRLIDADALLSIDRQIYDGDRAVGRRYVIYPYEVEDMPTIIEAEREEE